MTGAGGSTPAPGSATVPQGSRHHPAPDSCRWEIHQPAVALSPRPENDEASGYHHSSPSRQYSVHANQAARVTEISLESDHGTGLRGCDGITGCHHYVGKIREEDGNSARLRIVKIVKISTFLYD